jgi:hypothetical protein
MKLKRREFLKTSLTVSATAALGTQLQAAAGGSAGAREYYELRCYKVKSAAAGALDAYLEKALLPAFARNGVKTAGVFTELDVDKRAMTSKPKADSPVWMLVPHASLESLVRVGVEINADKDVQKAGGDYLNVPKASPAFDRVDSWLYVAFKGFPKHELPEYSKKRTPTRVFEMRDYQSHSELKAISKMVMFDEGEIEIMKTLNMGPVFFGEALVGPDLPHLRYITSGPDLATHLQQWSKFGPDPRWNAMKDLPQYKDNTSKNTPRFLTPKAYSQI